MAFDFPSSPTVGQTFNPAGGASYQWNGTSWIIAGSGSGSAMPSGQLVLIASKTISAPVATMDFTAGLDGTFDEYELHIINARCAIDGPFYLRISQDGGATWKTGATDYLHGAVFTSYTTASATYVGSNTSAAQISASHNAASTAWVVNGRVTFATPNVAGVRKSFLVNTAQMHPTIGHSGWMGFAAYATDANAINGLRIYAGGGNLVAGTFNLYGINKTGGTISDAVPANTKTFMDPHRVLGSGNPVIYTFTNNNLTITRVWTTPDYWTVLSKPMGRAGRKYFEAQQFGGNPIYCHIGAGPTSVYFENAGYYAGQNSNSIGYSGGGNFWAGGSSYPNYPSYVSGDWVGVVIDTALGMCAIRNITTNTGWNATAVANGNPGGMPPTGMNGNYPAIGNNTDISVLTTCYYVGQGFNLNFDGPFIGPVPAGCERWGA